MISNNGRLGAPVWAAIGLGAVMRVMFAFFYTSWHTSDAGQYFTQADAILQGRWIDYLPNGYPLMIAGLQRLTGPAAIESCLLVLNIVMSSAIVWHVAVLARRLAPGPIHVLAATLAIALWPNQLVQLRNFGSDIPAAYFLTLAVGWLCADRRIPAGLAIGAAIACRPSIAPAAAALGGVLWAIARRQSRQGPAFAFGAAALVPLALVAALGMSRGAGPRLDGHLGEVLTNADASFGGAFVAAGNDGDSSRDGLKTYRDRLLREPVYFARQRAAALWEMWGSWPADNGSGLLRQIAVAIRFPLGVFALVAWYAARRTPAASYLGLSVVMLTLVQAMLYALVRFMVPIEPLAIALASAVPVGLAYGRKDCERGESNPQSLSATGS
jgi:hypothetical protein